MAYVPGQKYLVRPDGVVMPFNPIASNSDGLTLHIADANGELGPAKAAPKTDMKKLQKIEDEPLPEVDEELPAAPVAGIETLPAGMNVADADRLSDVAQAVADAQPKRRGRPSRAIEADEIDAMPLATAVAVAELRGQDTTDAVA